LQFETGTLFSPLEASRSLGFVFRDGSNVTDDLVEMIVVEGGHRARAVAATRTETGRYVVDQILGMLRAVIRANARDPVHIVALAECDGALAKSRACCAIALGFGSQPHQVSEAESGARRTAADSPSSAVQIECGLIAAAP
jgi:hypothetical protein